MWKKLNKFNNNYVEDDRGQIPLTVLKLDSKIFHSDLPHEEMLHNIMKTSESEESMILVEKSEEEGPGAERSRLSL